MSTPFFCFLRGEGTGCRASASSPILLIRVLLCWINSVYLSHFTFCCDGRIHPPTRQKACPYLPTIWHLFFSTSLHCIDLSDDNSTRTKRWRRHCSVFVGGRGRPPRILLGVPLFCSICAVSRLEGGSERASEGDTKWAPLRSLPLCLCYAGGSSHGTSLANLLGLTFLRRWWSTLRFLFRPERLLRLLLISSSQRFLPFLEILRLLSVFGTWRRRRVIVQIVRFECTFRFSRQEEERGIRV